MMIPIYGGHSGQKRLYAKLRENFYWKGMVKDIAEMVKNCSKCQSNKARVKHTEPLVITTTPDKPFETVVIDTIGPLRKSDNCKRYILSLICDLTKFLILIPICNKEASTVAKAIVTDCILKFGPMKKILTDCGTEYVNSLMKKICSLMHVNHTTPTPYHHETVGPIERTHRVLNEYLRSYINENLNNWDEFINYFAFYYNFTPHSSFQFKYSPFELVFGRNPSSHESLLNIQIEPLYNIDNYAKQFKFQLQV